MLDDQLCDGRNSGAVLTQTKVSDPTQRTWKASWRRSLLSRRSKGQYCKKKSDSGSWNSMSKGPKQPGLASSGCLTGVHRALAPKPGISPSEKGPSLYHSLLGPPTARRGPFSSRLQESWALPRTASLARPARASPCQPHRSFLVAALGKHQRRPPPAHPGSGPSVWSKGQCGQMGGAETQRRGAWPWRGDTRSLRHDY